MESLESATAGTNADIHCAWKTWGKSDVFKIVRKGKGRKRRDKFFELEGDAASCIKKRGSKLPPLCRLYSIQGAAADLRSRVERGLCPPFQDLSDLGLYDIVEMLKGDFGFGWGDATVLHALTDMGLAVKPDRQLQRAMAALGLECEDPIKINQAVRKMRDEINRSKCLSAPASLRYLDKVLMEISRQGIMGKSSDGMAEDVLEMRRCLDRIEDRVGSRGKTAE